MATSNQTAIESDLNESEKSLLPFDISRAMAEMEDHSGDLFEGDELNRMFQKQKAFKKRTPNQQSELLRELNAKAFAMTFQIASNGITVEKGQGYYACCSRENNEEIDRILCQGIHPRKFKQLDQRLFIPEKIAVDSGDLETEISEIIHGSLRHEIGEVKYNDWRHFMLRQYMVEQKCAKGEMGKGWGKDYAYFINGVGDPRINYLVSRDSDEARKDILYSEMAGITGLLGRVGDLPQHHQFLMLANCREAESFAPSLVDLVKSQVDSTTLHYYEKHKPLLKQISRAEEIGAFYQLANQLWVDYAKNIVVCDEDRDMAHYQKLSDLWPMPSGMGTVHDRQNGVMIPRPGGGVQPAAIPPGSRIVNQAGNNGRSADKRRLSKEKIKEIADQIEAEADDSKQKAPLNPLISGDQERGKGKGGKAGKKGRKSNYRLRFSGEITELSHRFANNVSEFIPLQASAVKKRQSKGSLSVRSYINTQGKAGNIYNRLEKYMKYFAVFSVIVDTSGSMSVTAENKRSKMAFTKDAAYAFCDGLSHKGIPFELITYGSSDSKESFLEVIHSIHDLSEFSTMERNRFACVTATGGQSDVWALETSAQRLLPFARENECTPFFLLICDGCTGIDLKYAIRKIRNEGAIVVGVGIKLSSYEKKEFKTNFGNNGLFVDDMKQLVKEMTDKLKVEKNRILLFS